MKRLYLFIDLGPYPDHGCWGPSLPVEEQQKVELQERFIAERLHEIVEGKAIAVFNGGPWCRLEGEVGKHIFFKFKNKFPTDKEVRRLNTLLQDQGEEYTLVPSGHSSYDCVPAVVNALLHGEGCRAYQKVTLTEKINVQGCQIIPELLIPPRESLDF